ncbi:MAG TPA: response regulator, partial [Burkholderiales bacterium]|nr:response regulator [Burkholderiales bacterium]
QVLTNLVGNAIKFTEQGEVAVSVSCMEETEDSTTLRFEVIDTGPGITEEAQGRIFENFSQADGSTTRKHGGTGLGLAISKQLVEMMGGNMRVESKVGVGSTFWFAVRFDKADVQTDVEPVFRNKLEGVRALIVARNATARGTLNAQITNWGMKNRSVETPDQARALLTHAAARGAPYQIVILDSAMSGAGALELTRGIKSDAALSDARIVMLMPVGRHGDVRDARQAGVMLCLSKPVRQSALYNGLLSVVTGDAIDLAAIEPVKVAAKRENRGKLLLAEDNAVNQQVALAILKMEGYQVTIAKHGVEALEAYSKSTFDLILMDCHMPEMDGFEATRNIRETQKQSGLKRIPIIALTANAMQQDRDECLHAGMDDHLSKPYTRLQMRAMLDRWLPLPADAATDESAAKAA